MYQKQISLTSGMWTVFSVYSAVTVLVAVILRLLTEGSLRHVPLSVWIVPVLSYAFFALGNWKALKARFEELRILRGAAVAETSLEFKPIEPTGSAVSQFWFAVFVVGAYVAAWYF
jgi:hypothetical protein